MSSSAMLDLTPEDFEIVATILRAHVPERPVFIFGSRATGRARRRSDLDVAIGGSAPMSLRLCAELHDAFDKSDLPIRVDMVDLQHANGIFRKRIEGEWIPLEAAAEQLGLKVVL